MVLRDDASRTPTTSMAGFATLLDVGAELRVDASRLPAMLIATVDFSCSANLEARIDLLPLL